MECTFFIASHGIFSKVDQILGHKASLNKYKENHNRVKLEINKKRKYRNYPNTWRLNNSHLDDQVVIEEIRVDI
jgi:hypothetical protein